MFSLCALYTGNVSVHVRASKSVFIFNECPNQLFSGSAVIDGGIVCIGHDGGLCAERNEGDGGALR